MICKIVQLAGKRKAVFQNRLYAKSPAFRQGFPLDYRGLALLLLAALLTTLLTALTRVLLVLLAAAVLIFLLAALLRVPLVGIIRHGILLLGMTLSVLLQHAVSCFVPGTFTGFAFKEPAEGWKTEPADLA
ncbi:MAG: hypothetical protein AB7O79_07095 [Xanthobacteraceae bacterium]